MTLYSGMKKDYYYIFRNIPRMLNWASKEYQLDRIVASGHVIWPPPVASRGKAIGRFIFLQFWNMQYLIFHSNCCLYSWGNITYISASQENVNVKLCESTEDFICIFSLNQNGISDNLLKLANVVRKRKQKIVLDGQASSLADITAGVPSGSILGPLLFLIHMISLRAYLQMPNYL